MAKHLVLVLTEPNDGKEAEYHRYYEDQHLDEVLESTGWLNAQRYELVDGVGQDCPLPYLAIYETDDDDPKSIIPHMNATREQRAQSDSLNKRTAGVWVFRATGPEHTK